jgi:uncharacterized phiE125 gp8 family phage protein
MHVVVATYPQPIVTLEQAKAQLRVDFDDDDVLIQGHVAAATEALDGPDGHLRRSIGPQSLVATIEGFPRQPLRLRYPPITAVTRVAYVDPAGDQADVDPAAYRLRPDGSLLLAYGQAWPIARSRCDPVEVHYAAGYTNIPAVITQAILMITAELYANRGEAIAVDLVESPFIKKLLRNIRIPRG